MVRRRITANLYILATNYRIYTQNRVDLRNKVANYLTNIKIIIVLQIIKRTFDGGIIYRKIAVFILFFHRNDKAGYFLGMPT